MWPLILDAVARAVRRNRQRSQLRRIRAAAATIRVRSQNGHAATLVLEPWKFSIPESVLVQLARAAGYQPRSLDSDWFFREAFCFDRVAEANAGEMR